MSTAPNDRPFRILIAEDSPTQAQRLQRMLERQGYEVSHAANGRLALEAAERHKPDLIISDVVMPEMDGYELCRRVKDDGLGDIPVILVTTLSDPGDVIRGLECRADNFVLKPYDEQYLLSRVQFVLMNRVMRQSEPGGLAVDIFFNGRRHTITADRLQILNLLLSTYDAAIQRNKELSRTQEELRRTEAFLNSLIEHLPMPITVKDARDLRYIRVNRATEELLGLTRAEMLGKTSAGIFPAPEAAFFAAKDQEAIERRSPIEVSEAQVQSKTRGLRIVRSMRLPIGDDGGVPLYVLSIGEDITERREAERALAAAKCEAERANQAKSDFLSRMSHDLRTPLNAILGFAQLLESDGLTAEQRDSVRHILKGGGHLLDLINEVLDLARIESGHLSLSPEPVAIGDVVQASVALIRPLAARRHITVDDESLASCAARHVLADRQRLNQILMNLLSNAVKYNREGGRVQVTCETLDGRVRIKVTDSGAGIPPEQLEMLFQPFERLGAAETEIEGTGLGLALSRALAEAMGGTLGVISVVDQGSTFWVELQESDGEAEAERPPATTHDARTPDSGVSGTILYIEDNVSNQRLMERLLARRPGVTLVTVATGQAGLDLARSAAPSIILLDLHLPDLDGNEVLRRLREDPGTRAIPVVVLSADAAPSRSKRLIAAGATAFLTKPLNIAEILELLDTTLAKAN